MWQSSDLKAFVSATSSLPTTTTAISAKTTLATSPTNTGTNNTGGGGLSNGAKIGLGVGIPLAFIAIAIGAFCFWWRRRRMRGAPVATSEVGMVDMKQELAEMQGEGEVSEMYVEGLPAVGQGYYDPHQPKKPLEGQSQSPVELSSGT